MTSEAFLRMLEIYGADPMRWPVYQRRAALHCRAALDPTSQGLLEREQRLDRLLNKVDSPPVSRALRMRVMLAIPPEPASLVRRHPWWSGAGLIGVATVGIAAGILFVSMLTAPIYKNMPMPGSPYDAASFRQDAFYIPPPFGTEGN